MLELFVTKYGGIDWVAMIFVFFSLYLLGSKKRIGFVLGFLGNIAWIVFNVYAESAAGILANIVFGFLNIRGYLRWRKPELTTEKTV